MSLRQRIAIVVLLALGAASIGFYSLSPTTKPILFSQQVYIWQRLWTSQHREALQQSRTLFSALHVLGLQVHQQEGIRHIAVHTALLKQDGRPIWLVVRLDGQLVALNKLRIVEKILQTLAEWTNAGLQIDGIEIDYDAPTAKLAEYQQFLIILRHSIPETLRLNITALPTWLESPLLPTLLRTADGSVLQVHYVLSPAKGLFDPRLAQRWIAQYAGIAAHPFWVALPAYGSALTDSRRVESEVSLYEPENLQELSVAPQTLATFMSQLEQNPPAGLQGFVWFRLPLAGDRRAWSLATLEAVIRHQPLTPRWSLVIKPHRDPMLYDLAIKNSGNVDAPLPRQIELNAACALADAAGHYEIQTNSPTLRFLRVTHQQLRAGESSPLGWVRCAEKLSGAINVTQ